MRVRTMDETLVHFIDNAMFQSSVEAVTATHMGEQSVYGLPTLLCGNFLTSIDPATLQVCPINIGTAPYSEYKHALETCVANEPQSYNSLIMGKMYNGKGSYLPDIYLDGYIDIYGQRSLQRAIDDLLSGTVDEELCNRLTWFTNLCKTSGGVNKCNSKLDIWVNYNEAVFDQIVQHKSLLMFSFSENLSILLQKANTDPHETRTAHALASVSFGETNNLLQYTDGLVTGKKQWQSASQEKKDVINAFNKFFIQTDVRKMITTGADVTPQKPRYLIVPNKSFYSDSGVDSIYKAMVPFLEHAVPAPYISDTDRKEMLKTLTTKCVRNFLASSRSKKTEL